MDLNLTFWGKSASDRPAFLADNRDAPAYKPVLHHLLDVAAVAQTFLAANAARLRREAAPIGMAPDAYARLIAFFVGLHDLGKFSRPFQWKIAELWPGALGLRPAEPPAGPNHWRTTALHLQDSSVALRFRAYLPKLAPGYESPLVAAIAGHHGAPPPVEAGMPKWAQDARDAICATAATEAFAHVAELTCPAPAEHLDEDGVRLLSWRLSGLTVLADWVGSDADYFGLAPLDMALADYWRGALRAAGRALAAKGLLPSKPVAAPRLHHFAPTAASSPRPMQSLAETVKLSDGPQLVMIEDATGSGKTEAAIVLAARMMAAGRGEGVFVALPTMATANAMYERLKNVTDAFFERASNDAQRASLILAHGKAALSRDLSNLSSPPLADGEPSSALTCNAWIADDRRRAFFADIGAGTIDQAFLAVLPKKHVTLRQYALAGRVLIVDEAHCFDAYMKEELSALLRLHAMNGGSAIVLSATLSLGARRDIAKSFLQGVGFKKQEAERMTRACASLDYPLLTHIDASGVHEMQTEMARGLERSVEVVRLDDRAAACDATCKAAEVGAAVLVICNAVDEAVAMHEALAAVRPNGTVHLFHARFAQGDRLAIEDGVLARFGRNSKPQNRNGHVLVATQVVEQSLDLDFDLVISDLAPIDLLIQRAGRLWRHMDLRPASMRATPQSRLMIVSSDPETAASADWLRPCLGKGASVYQHAGIMWRSARRVFECGRIRVPEGLRLMIEAVYGAATEPVPQTLAVAEQKGAGKDSAAKALGAMNVIDLQEGYGALPSDLRIDEDIGTRLGEPTVRLRLARRVDGVLVPWDRTPGAPLHVAWALSEVKVRQAFWGNVKPLAADETLREAARRDWPEWDKAVEIAEVADDGRLRLQNADFFYDVKYGLKKL